jgi:hypothetical protein
MNRNPIYATSASFTNRPSKPQQPREGQVIRPPLRDAYDSQKQYDEAHQQGMIYAKENYIPYIDNYDY